MRGRIQALSVLALIALVAVACGGGAPEQREIGTGAETISLAELVKGSGAEFYPSYKYGEKMTKADYEAAGRKAKNQKWGVVKEAPSDARPVALNRPQYSSVNVSGTSGTFYGIRPFSEYVNEDGIYTEKNCGQAAAATLICTFGGYCGTDGVRRLDNNVWKYGPDALLGAAGSSPERVRVAVDDHLSYRAGWVSGGATALRSWVKARSPVAVLLDMGYIGDRSWGGHYVVVFGYDSKYYYVTNNWESAYGWNRIPRTELESGWNNGIPWWAGVGGKFLGVYS